MVAVRGLLYYSMGAPGIPPSSPTDTARPDLRAKTVATRLSPEELQEVENAAERDWKSLAKRVIANH
jgi:hypothetical protein